MFDDDEEIELEGSTGWKSTSPVSFALDAEKEGDVLVAFAKIGVVDKDRHVTESGAMPTKRVPISAYAHASWPEKGGRLPTGIGETGEKNGEAMFAGRFLLDTTHGLDTYRTVKALGDLQEWSYGYRILGAERGKADGKPVVHLKKLDVFEVSPTLVGAGIGTRTVSIKSEGGEALAGLPFADHVDRVLVDVAGLVARSKSLRDLRAKDGRELSETNRARLTRLRDSIAALEETRSELEELLTRTERSDPEAKAVGRRLLAEYERTTAQLAGVSIPVGG